MCMLVAGIDVRVVAKDRPILSADAHRKALDHIDSSRPDVVALSRQEEVALRVHQARSNRGDGNDREDHAECRCHEQASRAKPAEDRQGGDRS